MSSRMDRHRCRIVVDFDGTVAEHEYPDIGPPVPGAIETLKELKALGHWVGLFTMRSDKYLEEASDWLRNHGVELDAVNVSEQGWTNSPKMYGHVYIDDAAIGCPLRDSPKMGGRPMVDWDKVRDELRHRSILPEESEQ